MHFKLGKTKKIKFGNFLLTFG